MNASLAIVTIRTVTVAGEAVDPNQKRAWTILPLANTGQNRPDAKLG